MRSFEIAVEDDVLNRIMQRVSDYRWPAEPAAPAWGLGPDPIFMRKLQRHWLESYDWRKEERGLNRFSQFKATVDDQEIYFIHERSSRPAAAPILLIHGWPGSTVEFQELISPLAHPARFGSDPALGCDVVVAALPGYGFSGAPLTAIGPRRTAAILNELMTGVLGYRRYFTQGGDWGSLVSAWIGYDWPESCAGIHLNLVGCLPAGEDGGPRAVVTCDEKTWMQSRQSALAAEGGYYAQQSTRPQTLGYGLNDSPMGVAAWIIDKFHAWSDLGGKGLDDVFRIDDLITNIMIYLVTDSFNTSTWMYRGASEEGILLPAGRRVEVPVGIANFPKDIVANPPRSYVEHGYNVVHWSDFEQGGHFAALEQPGSLLGDIRQFLATYWR